MPLDIAAQVASLKNDYGANKGPNAPASFSVDLYTDNPLAGGVVMPSITDTVDVDGDPTTVANGYAAAVVNNDGATFPSPDPVTGVLTSALITWPASNFAYPVEAKYWVLRQGSVRWDYGEIPRDQWIYVDRAGVVPRLTLSIFYRGEL